MSSSNKPIIMEYLGNLVKARLNEEASPEIPQGITPEELEKIAVNSQMIYLILGGIVSFPMDEYTRGSMKTRIVKSTMKTLAQVCTAKEISDAFEEAGIRNQVLKGTIMKSIYPRPEMREMSDVDMMVYEDTFEKADEIVLGMGYKRGADIKHHIVYSRAPFLYFEMHWDLYEKSVDKGQYMYYKNSFRAKLKGGTKYTYEFTNEDFYVYLISHMAKHFYEQGCGIRNLMDIYVYKNAMKEQVDWKNVSEELEKLGLTVFEKSMSELSYIWLDGKESNEFYNNLFMYMLECGIYGKKENGVWAQIAKQSQNESAKGSRIRYIFPTYSYMVEQFRWLEGKAFLLPVAWGGRIVKAVLDKDARNRANEFIHDPETQKMYDIYHNLKLNYIK